MNQDLDDLAAYERDQRRRKGTTNLVFGLVFVAVGLAITLATYDHATSHGGRYVVALGPILFGVLRAFRGIVQLTSDAPPQPELVLADEQRQRRRRVPGSIVWGLVGLAIGGLFLDRVAHQSDAEPIFWLVGAMPAFFGVWSLLRAIAILCERPLRQ